MIEESAEVVRSQGDLLWVSVSRRSACASCSAAKGCGQKRILDWLPSQQIEVQVANPDCLVLRPGQRVILGLEEGALVRASVLLYLLPLLGLILFTLVTNFLQLSELFQILAAMLGLTLGFVATRLIALRELALGAYEPILIRIE